MGKPCLFHIVSELSLPYVGWLSSDRKKEKDLVLSEVCLATWDGERRGKWMQPWGWILFH